ncbi:CsgG/HfaB family protein [Hymenobacter sp. DG25A]|uniref:CsgG/HfaB family protein n=1 Tax=Hymenobacter sp. DG25A TaxID=1385663 RepID=UPI000AF7108F|nr:CsgG/HfaB family protein [Hymenobacter sp. DG25A]
MTYLMRWLRTGLMVGVGLLASCAPYFHQPFASTPARLGAELRANSDFKSLPAAQQRVVVAVYKFRDQTGQYKPSANGSSFSTALTQGATSILLRALEESQWFDPIERENLGNLLNERKIIRSSRAEYSDQGGGKQQQPLLPPLLFAGVLLEGGIISYDANVITGGAGLRYFGAGASGQYRQDRVTVYLRAISTSNGKILKTVYTTKTILSQQVDASLFRFVKFKRLLETETGFTYNEPTEMAVKDAIEKSVQSLILEGIHEGLWSTRNPQDQNGPALQAYLNEKKENLNIDFLDRTLSDRRGHLGAGLLVGGQRYAGDYKGALTRPGAEVTLRYTGPLDNKFSVAVNIGQSQLAASDYYKQTLYYAELCGLYRLLPRDKYTPYLLAGAGFIVKDALERRTISKGSNYLPHLVAGVGMEYMLTNRVGLSAVLNSHYVLSDNLDDTKQGKYNDYYWGALGGVTFYIGGTLNRVKSQATPKK